MRVSGKGTGNGPQWRVRSPKSQSLTRSQSRRRNFLALPPPRSQLPAVRGSPIFRFIFLVFALAAAAFGLMRVTSAGSRAAAPVSGPPFRQPLPPVSYRLVISADAAKISVETGKSTTSTLTGTLDLDPANPRVALAVRWKSAPPAGETRFAKLTIEAPGRETFVHVFDAPGDIDDLVELPFPPAP
jgi:hypothetical protein